MPFYLVGSLDCHSSSILPPDYFFLGVPMYIFVRKLSRPVPILFRAALCFLRLLDILCENM